MPYQDLAIMEACLAAKVNYVDTANYEPEDTAKFEYSWQWAYRKKFEDAGITALLGSGFDPGVTGVFSAYAQKHYFDEINYIDILDCNAGDHGYPFATNFNRRSISGRFPPREATGRTAIGWRPSPWRSNGYTISRKSGTRICTCFTTRSWNHWR